MRKFLAVLLAVALLGVAGAAFAVDAGHVTPGKSDSGNKVVVNSTAVKAKVAKPSLNNEVAGVKATAVDETAASKDVEDYAAKGYIVAAVVPTLSVDQNVEEISLDIKFDDSYKNQTVSADLRKQATGAVALAGGTMDYYLASNDVTKSTDVVPSDGKMVLVIKNPASGTYKPIVTIAATKAIEGVTEESGINADIYDAIAKDFGPFTEVTLKTKQVTSADKKAKLTFDDFTVAAPGSYASKVIDFTAFASAAKSGAALSVDIDGSYVTLAAGATFEKAAVYSETAGKTAKVFSGNGYVAYKVSAVSDATAKHTMAVVADAQETPTTGPTSSKGSGGCNGGFAGIAVLALGLAALRRKAR